MAGKPLGGRCATSWRLGYAAPVSHVVSNARARSIAADGAAGTLRRTISVLFVGAAVGLALDRGWLVCPVAALFSVPCPGCGITRAALLLAHGDWKGAVGVYPLAPLLVPLALVAAARAALDYIVRPGLPGTGPGWRWGRLDAPWFGPWGKRAAAVVVAAMIVVWVLRFRGAFGGPVPLAMLLDG